MSDGLFEGAGSPKYTPPAGNEPPVGNEPPAGNDPPGGEPFARGPDPTASPLPDWVPTEYQDPDQREALLKAIGVENAPEPVTERPEWLPEKFWSDEDGMRVDALAKSYNELQTKLGKAAEGPPEKYEVELPDGVELEDGVEVLSEEDEAVFKELGLTNDQAQKLVGHFWESVVPLIAEKQAELEHQKLVQEWGFETADQDAYRQRLGAIKEWGEANLPKEALDSMKGSSDGIKALYSMMTNRMTPAGESAPAAPDLGELEDIINSDEYWQEGNEGMRAKVQAQYEQALRRRS